MLGLVEKDLKQAIGVEVEGVPMRYTLFGFRNDSWKPWKMQDGLEVLVSEDFKTMTAENGDPLIYPRGNTAAPPSGRMPKGGYFFDTIIRQEEIDDSRLDPADNLEEFGLMPERPSTRY